MSDDKDFEEAFQAWEEQHRKQEDHEPGCYLAPQNCDTKASSGAVSNAYRAGWEGVFGTVPTGSA